MSESEAIAAVDQMARARAVGGERLLFARTTRVLRCRWQMAGPHFKSLDTHARGGRAASGVGFLRLSDCGGDLGLRGCGILLFGGGEEPIFGFTGVASAGPASLRPTSIKDALTIAWCMLERARAWLLLYAMLTFRYGQAASMWAARAPCYYGVSPVLLLCGGGMPIESSLIVEPSQEGLYMRAEFGQEGVAVRTTLVSMDALEELEGEAASRVGGWNFFPETPNVHLSWARTPVDKFRQVAHSYAARKRGFLSYSLGA